MLQIIPSLPEPPIAPALTPPDPDRAGHPVGARHGQQTS